MWRPMRQHTHTHTHIFTSCIDNALLPTSRSRCVKEIRRKPFNPIICGYNKKKVSLNVRSGTRNQFECFHTLLVLFRQHFVKEAGTAETPDPHCYVGWVAHPVLCSFRQLHHLKLPLLKEHHTSCHFELLCVVWLFFFSFFSRMQPDRHEKHSAFYESRINYCISEVWHCLYCRYLYLTPSGLQAFYRWHK